MKIIVSAKECKKLFNNYKEIEKALKDSGEKIAEINQEKIVKKFRSRIISAKINFNGSVVITVNEDFIGDVADLYTANYFLEIINNIEIVRPCVKFLVKLCINLNSRSKALSDKWFADAKTGEEQEPVPKAMDEVDKSVAKLFWS